MTLKKSLFVALVAVGTLSMVAENSNAFFGLFGRGSGGSWGGGGSRGGWGSCGSHGGWSGSHGSYGGWGGSHGSDGGWGGSHGSYGGGGSHGSYGGGGGYAYYDGGYARRGRIFDGGYARRERVYYGPVVSNEPVVRETVVARPAAAATKTRLTLHVPAEASVTLAGVPTKQTGETRQYTTTRLPSGQVWDGYTIVVSMERNGQTLRQERTIQLTGGQAQELSIDFDSEQLAQMTL